MYEGKITGFRDPDVPAAELGRLMAGGADAPDRGTSPRAGAPQGHRPRSSAAQRPSRPAPEPQPGAGRPGRPLQEDS